MEKKQIAAIALVLIGILSIILAFSAYGMEVGDNEGNTKYGGDAYTGIQNAAAQTARNVVKLTKAVTFSAGSILLIGGMALIAVGIGTWDSENASSNGYSYSGIIAQTYMDQNTGWTCVCGKKNSNFAAICSCGRTKQQMQEMQEKVTAGPVVHLPDGWRCSCGREHPAYVSTCPCGTSKGDIK